MRKFKKQFLTTAITLTLPLIALFSASPAQADVKTYSGSVCQATYGTQEGDFYKYTSSIYNRSSGYRWMTCGIARDRVSSTGGAWVAYIYVEPASSSHRTYCYLDELRVNGNVAQRRSSSRLGTGWISLDTSLSESYGHRAIYCYVPSKGQVDHLRVYEHNTFD